MLRFPITLNITHVIMSWNKINLLCCDDIELPADSLTVNKKM